jgi:N-acetylmuramoyl-L-alanine amidase
MLKQGVAWWVTIGVLLLAVAGQAAAAIRVGDMRYFSAPDHTRIVVESDQPLSFQTMELKGPERLVIDLKDAATAVASPRSFTVGDSIVQRVRVARFNGETVRLVMDLVQPVQSKIFLLNPLEDKPYRLVIDLNRSDLAEQEQKARVREQSRERRIIVIDPGHGGDDVGAVSRRGTYEKDIVLALGKKMRDCINRKPGFKAFLTRDGDYFIPLEKRIAIARDYGADFFISLHTDANLNKSVRGASVYCLSLKGASDEAARLLAERENASDMFGGVSYADDKDLNSILVDLVQTQTMNDSLHFGGLVLNALAGLNQVKFSHPKQARFVVLRAAEIPSVLIETGFITNPEDERLLKSSSFQQKLAGSLSDVTYEFVSLLAKRDGIALPGAPAKTETERGMRGVKPRETLSQMARERDVTVANPVRGTSLRKTDQAVAGKKR